MVMVDQGGARGVGGRVDADPEDFRGFLGGLAHLAESDRVGMSVQCTTPLADYACTDCPWRHGKLMAIW